MRGFLLIRLCAVDMDAVGGGIVGHAEVHRFADVPEADVIVPADGIGGEGCLLAVDVEGLAAGPSGEVIRRLDGGAAQGKADKDAQPHKYRFPLSVHDDSPFGLL